jgi:hypothetical protein
VEEDLAEAADLAEVEVAAGSVDLEEDRSEAAAQAGAGKSLVECEQGFEHADEETWIKILLSS